MSEVKRYHASMEMDGGLYEHKTGAVVKYKDYKALREDVARLTKLNEQLMEDIMKIRDHALDHFEFIEAVQSPQAALTQGKGGANG